MEEIATLYDMSNTLIGDFLVPVREKPIPLITVEDRSFIYDPFDSVYREVQRYHISQILN